VCPFASLATGCRPRNTCSLPLYTQVQLLCAPASDPIPRPKCSVLPARCPHCCQPCASSAAV
jgi:hypothetical protein